MKRILAILAVLVMIAGCDLVPDNYPPETRPAKAEPVTETLQIIDFYATWCGPCKLQAPKIRLIENDGYDVVRVNVDEDVDRAKEYNIHSVPTYVVLINGKEEYRTQSAWSLADWLRKHDERSVQKSKGKVSNVPKASRTGAAQSGAVTATQRDGAAGDETVETCSLRDRHLHLND